LRTKLQAVQLYIVRDVHEVHSNNVVKGSSQLVNQHSTEKELIKALMSTQVLAIVHTYTSASCRLQPVLSRDSPPVVYGQVQHCLWACNKWQ